MDLKSRDGEVWKLTKVEKGYTWILPGYTRLGFFPDNNKDICFVDPPGGPFLEVGREIVPGELIVGFQDEGDSILILTHKKEG